MRRAWFVLAFSLSACGRSGLLFGGLPGGNDEAGSAGIPGRGGAGGTPSGGRGGAVTSGAGGIGATGGVAGTPGTGGTPPEQPWLCSEAGFSDPSTLVLVGFDGEYLVFIRADGTSDVVASSPSFLLPHTRVLVSHGWVAVFSRSQEAVSPEMPFDVLLFDASGVVRAEASGTSSYLGGGIALHQDGSVSIALRGGSAATGDPSPRALLLRPDQGPIERLYFSEEPDSLGWVNVMDPSTNPPSLALMDVATGEVRTMAWEPAPFLDRLPHRGGRAVYPSRIADRLVLVDDVEAGRNSLTNLGPWIEGSVSKALSLDGSPVAWVTVNYVPVFLYGWDSRNPTNVIPEGMTLEEVATNYSANEMPLSFGGRPPAGCYAAWASCPSAHSDLYLVTTRDDALARWAFDARTGRAIDFGGDIPARAYSSSAAGDTWGVITSDGEPPFVIGREGLGSASYQELGFAPAVELASSVSGDYALIMSGGLPREVLPLESRRAGASPAFDTAATLRHAGYGWVLGGNEERPFWGVELAHTERSGAFPELPEPGYHRWLGVGLDGSSAVLRIENHLLARVFAALPGDPDWQRIGLPVREVREVYWQRTRHAWLVSAGNQTFGSITDWADIGPDTEPYLAGDSYQIVRFDGSALYTGTEPWALDESQTCALIGSRVLDLATGEFHALGASERMTWVPRE